jgi:hypothetical protein
MIITWSGGRAWTIAETSGALLWWFTFCKCWLNALQNKSICEEMLSDIYSLCYNGLCCPIQSQITCAYLLDVLRYRHTAQHCFTMILRACHSQGDKLACWRDDLQLDRRTEQGRTAPSYCTLEMAGILKEHVNGMIVRTFSAFRWLFRLTILNVLGQ